MQLASDQNGTCGLARSNRGRTNRSLILFECLFLKLSNFFDINLLTDNSLFSCRPIILTRLPVHPLRSSSLVIHSDHPLEPSVWPPRQTKGTASFGKRHVKTHVSCRRCGRRAFHAQKKVCASCAYPNSKIRKCKLEFEILFWLSSDWNRSKQLKLKSNLEVRSKVTTH